MVGYRLVPSPLIRGSFARKKKKRVSFVTRLKECLSPRGLPFCNEEVTNITYHSPWRFACERRKEHLAATNEAAERSSCVVY